MDELLRQIRSMLDQAAEELMFLPECVAKYAALQALCDADRFAEEATKPKVGG